MKSKASIKSHPLHPILVAFPIVFFIGTFLADLLGVFTDHHSLIITGLYLNIAGVFGAVAAAVPGLIDFIFTVPPKSSASKRAAKHGIINTSVLLLFSFVLWYKHSAHPNTALILLPEAVGVILLSIAGWLGGTLVYRNQIGVDIRYANAGKWKEEYPDDSNGSVKVGRADELQLNNMKLVHLRGKRIVIARTENGFVAFDDYCTHRGGSLAGGSMICGTVQCPWHGSQFDVHTGAVKSGPAKEKIQTYEVHESGGDIFISL